MAAAAHAAIHAAGGMDRMPASTFSKEAAAARAPCTKQLPPEQDWIKSGLLYKRTFGHSVPWQSRRVVLASDYFCITRPDSNDVIERFDLLTLEGIGPSHDSSDTPVHERRGSTLSVESVLKQSSTLHPENEKKGLQVPNKPALQFKVVDEHDYKRRFCFGASSQSEISEWMDALKNAVRAAEDQERKQHWWRSNQLRLKKFYESTYVQTVVAILIIGNFAMAVAKAQLVPEKDSETDKAMYSMELLFTVLFLVELIINMTSNFLLPFWKDWWNVLDFCIVTVSIIAIPLNDVKGFNLLRMARVFRVIRVFNSLKALKTIILALTSAIIPVSNAFAVLAVATAIYAVIGVGLYEEADPVQFGDFTRAIFTMFQVITGDSWATTIARPMFGEDQDPAPGVTLFFASYILIVGTFLLNVVVAVLLDEFISSVQIGKAEQRKNELNKKKTANCLDTLLASFGACDDDQALSDMIKVVYSVLDSDDSGGLSFEEFRDGLLRLDTHPIIYLSPENFDEITEHGTLCDKNGELDLEAFETVIRHQLKAYTQRRATFEMVEADGGNSAVSAVLLMAKQLALDLQTVQQTLDGLTGGSLAGRGGNGAEVGESGRRCGAGSRSALTNPNNFSRAGSAYGASDKVSRGGDMGSPLGEAGREEAATMQRMDKKLSRLYSKLHSLHEVMAGAGDGRGRSRGSRGKSRQRHDEEWDEPEWDRESGEPERGGWADEGSGRTRRERGGGKAVNPDVEDRGASSPQSMVDAVLARLDGIERRIGDVARDQRALTTRLERKIDGLARAPQPPPARPTDSADAYGPGGDAGSGPTNGDGSWKEDERTMSEAEGFIGATATQLMMAGMARNMAKAKGGGGQLNAISKFLNPKTRRALGEKGGSRSPYAGSDSAARNLEDDGLVTGELTFDAKGGRWEGRRGSGVTRAGIPPFMMKGSGEPVAVRVSWLSVPSMSPALALDPPSEQACDGCHQCHNGYIGVGCLVCGEKLAMVASTEELLGNEHQVAGPDFLAVLGQGLLRRHAHYDKAIDPSKFVDTPHGDGRHWFRCYLLLSLSAPFSDDPFPSPQDNQPLAPPRTQRRSSLPRNQAAALERRGSLPRTQAAAVVGRTSSQENGSPRLVPMAQRRTGSVPSAPVAAMGRSSSARRKGNG